MIVKESDKVLKGKDNWLFLDKDTNNSPGQFRGEVLLSEKDIKEYSEYFDKLNKKITCKFCFVLAPTKEYIHPDKYPFKMRVEGERVLIHEQFCRILEDKGIKYTYPVSLLAQTEDTFYKTDTHWSDYGAYLTIKNTFSNIFDNEVVVLDKEDFIKESVFGDLGSKLDVKKSDTRLIYPRGHKKYQVFDSYLTNHGYIDHYINDESMSTEKILIFGDSFGFQFLNPLVLTFREVVFVYLPASFVEDIYDIFKPDKLIFQINQRFLTSPPKYRKHINDSLVFKKIKRMSTAELKAYEKSIKSVDQKSAISNVFMQGISAVKVAQQESEGLIFDGKDVRVISRLFENCNQIVVTFTSRSDTPIRNGFGEKYFIKKGIPAIHFISKKNHWWQVDEMHDAIKKVKKIVKSYHSICTYGASMGAHGALIFSKELEATSVIAGSPQYAINGRLVPWTPRWTRDTQDVSEKFPIEKCCSTSAKIYCIFDPFENLDQAHISELSKIRDIIQIHTPFVGHSAILNLQKNGLLSPLVEKAVSGNLRSFSYIEEIKKSRRSNLGYLFGLASRASKRESRKKISEWAFGKASEVAIGIIASKKERVSHNEILQVLKSHCKNLINKHLYEDALNIAVNYCEAYPSIPQSHELLCDVFWKAKDYESALLEARRALKYDKKTASLRLLVARLFLIIGQTEEADYHFKVALGLPSKSKKVWLAALSDVQRYASNKSLENQIERKLKDIDPTYKIEDDLRSTGKKYSYIISLLKNRISLLLDCGQAWITLPDLSNLSDSYTHDFFENSKLWAERGNYVFVHKENESLSNLKISFSGTNNVVLIGKNVDLGKSSINLMGKEGVVIISDYCKLKQCSLLTAHRQNSIFIGEKTTWGKGNLAAAEDQCSVIIGDFCMFSSGINCHTSDYHPIVDLNSGERINPAASIVIKDRVWLTRNVSVSKGVNIESGCVIAQGSLVTKDTNENCVYAGVPAKLIRSNIVWKRSLK